MTDWTARKAALRASDGDEWDRLHAALETDWKAAYVAEFVRFGLTRNWTEDNAREWAEEIQGDAFIDGDTDPVKQAQTDVKECEWESANAC